MIWRLLVSALLCAVVLPLVWSSMPHPRGEGASLLVLATGLLLGWHRVLLRAGTNAPLTEVLAPHGERMEVRYTIWGIPLSSTRPTRIATHAEQFTREHPTLSRAAECLPWPLSRLVRRMLLRRHNSALSRRQRRD